MATEESPLLSEALASTKHEIVYQRFSPTYKKFLVAIVSWCGLMPLFISGTFYPTIPTIARDLNTSGQNVSLAVSLSVFAAAVGAFISASYSTFYGRRPIYLFALPLSVVGSIGVATSQTMPQLLFWRFWQCIGASPGLVVGAGVIGDIYKLEERGSAMGFFFAGILLGPALAPPVGGFMASYASWRIMQQLLGLFCLVAFVIIFLAFPETSHPGARGIDKVRQSGEVRRSWLPRFVNPLKPLDLLRSPNICCAVVAGFFILLTDYVLIVPIAYTIGKRYNIVDEALIGACFLPSGVGNMIGAPLAGRISDRVIVRWKKKRGGIWYPEDRLRATLLGGLLLAPLSVLGCGLVTHYVPGKVGLALNMLFFFFNGLGVDIVLSPIAAYSVDIMHSRSAEVMACANGSRSLLLAFATAGIMPMINAYGFLATTALSAILTWMGFGLLILTMYYGEEMRAWADVGYSTSENN
ncbi:hypothetical protein Agabi119p4_3809 [Agaricus bisporus var. burnettii]|uniref:Major facilitator superfamily (MFS) profile domain-containing protein n=1 Tax=Agaricus bisporus var. burnettii TaxID=192524 RepID=A0A8H7F5H9_AGABI|nr:hypothetical protein Agabi119p4_3809 [Agaricus bisporus var. burnettii]